MNTREITSSRSTLVWLLRAYETKLLHKKTHAKIIIQRIITIQFYQQQYIIIIINANTNRHMNKYVMQYCKDFFAGLRLLCTVHVCVEIMGLLMFKWVWAIWKLNLIIKTIFAYLTTKILCSEISDSISANVECACGTELSWHFIMSPAFWRKFIGSGNHVLFYPRFSMKRKI